MVQHKISVATLTLKPPADLMIDAVCHYFGTTRESLLVSDSDREKARRRGLLFYALKSKLQMQTSEISALCDISRQNVEYLSRKTETETNIYLHSVCDLKNIEGVYLDLRSKQVDLINNKRQWLKNHSRKISL